MHFSHLLAIGQCLDHIFNEGQLADRVLEYVLKADKRRGTKDRAFIAEHVYSCVRHWRLLRFCAGLPYSDTQNSVEEEEIWAVMATLLKWEGHNVREFRETASAANFIPPSTDNLAEMPLEVRYSIPDWLFAHLKSELSDDLLEQELKAQDVQAPFFVRVNRLKTDTESLERYFEALELPSERLGADYPDALRILTRRNIMRTEAFLNGHFEVQDISSQRVAALLAPKSGERLIDACAGAGGKALHLASLMQNGGRVLALDADEKRLIELKRRAARAGASNIEARGIESSKTIKRLENSADKLLLDVPCTGMGVLRRNPDAKWRLTSARLQELTQIQQQILGSYPRMLRSGGHLLYATCSILGSENGHQIQQFLAKNSQFSLLKEEPIYTSPQGGDGFYMALLEKTS